MDFKLIIIILDNILLPILVYCIYKLFNKNKTLTIENTRLQNQCNYILKELKENEDKKQTLHTGNSNTDFNNSINLLQKYSERNNKP